MNSNPAQFDPYQPFRPVLLRPERLRELSRLRPVRAVWDMLTCWVLIGAAWALVAWHPAWYTVIPAIVVIASRYYALTIIGHDGLHRRLFETKARNDFINDLVIMAPIGAITRLNNVNHLNHHADLATPEDPDRYKHACFNKAEAAEFLLYLTGVGIIGQRLQGVLLKRSGAGLAGANERERKNYTARDLALVISWQVALWGGLSLAVAWWAYPVLWMLPVYLGAYVADNIRSFAEHSHPEADAVADRHRLLTYVSNPLERALLAPMNMNYHATHHLYPSIPYYNLPVADAEIRRNPVSAGLEWRQSYLRYLIRYYGALPIEDCRRAGARGNSGTATR
jgi:fatty acid desaturase